MRAVWFAYVLVLVSVATGVMAEFNEMHIKSKGYPILPMVVQGHVYTTLSEDSYNATISSYGLDRVPSVAEDSAYLGTSGTLLSTYNAFQGIFQVSTLGFNKFLSNIFPYIAPSWLLGVSLLVTLNNAYAAIALLRGVAIRWL